MNKEVIHMPEATINEAMFSSIYNLGKLPEEILLRIHPKKKVAYDAIVEGKTVIKQNDQEIKIVDIVLVLNKPKSQNLINIGYSTIYKNEVSHFVEKIQVEGFDENGEPIIYKMKDGTIRVVFSELPRNNNQPFDLDKFSKKIINSLNCDMVHDDREIFHIQNPKEDTVEKIRLFLSNYK